MNSDNPTTLSQHRDLKFDFRRSGQGCISTRFSVRKNKVMIFPTDTKEWLLRWPSFESARWSSVGKGERIELFFHYHHVIAEGENLKELFSLLDDSEITTIRSLASKFRSLVPADEIFITRLEVRLLSEKDQLDHGDLPF